MTEQNFPLYEEAVSVLKRRDKKLAWLIERVGPLSHTDLKDDFRFFIEQVIGQMLSIQAADVMTGRLSDLCRGEMTAGAICSLSVYELKKTGTNLVPVLLGFQKSSSPSTRQESPLSLPPEL